MFAVLFHRFCFDNLVLDTMKILFVSLGCDKNSVDSEVMLGFLNEAGHTFTDDENEAEVAIVNTCCFINDAKEESINTIISLGERRRSGQLKALIVTGCLGQRYTESIHTDLPEVDAIVGISSIDQIAEILDGVLANKARDMVEEPVSLPKSRCGRIITTGGYYDYLKIAEGCDKHCTYCVIPKIRGKFRSYPMEDLVSEAENLAQRGVRELILVAQETTLYGIDIYGKKMLPELLRKLCAIDGLEMIRLLYCYPEEITDELIDVIADEPKIAKYIDMPVQSGSDEILKRMGRRTDSSQIRNIVYTLRKRIPDICIRTTLISGFPGEKRKHHLETLRMVKELEFDRLGVFCYSQEEGTPAAKMKGQLPMFVKKMRLQSIMKTQQEIAFRATAGLVGKDVRVLIEGYIPEDGVYVGRTYRDAPGVDGLIFLKSDRELLSGDIADAVVTGSNEYDLIGEVK